MRLFVVGALLAGCFDPRPPSGIACDPVNPQCPGNQLCLPQGNGFACGGDGTLPPDAPTDTAPPTDAPFGHVQLAPGYQIELFQDFSAAFTYDANDWPEQTEVHDNQPSYLFTSSAPYPVSLGVLAGREIFALDGNQLESFDFGNHPINTPGQADNLTGAVIAAANPNEARTLFVSSSSEDTGDGLFEITPTGEISTDLAQNNTRSLLVDPQGTFDGGNAPQRYLGSQGGIVRRSDAVTIITGDTRSMRLLDDDLLITRTVALEERLIRIKSTTHTETVLATRPKLRISEGAPPANAIAWAIAEDKQLVLAAPDGTLDVIAELLDSGYIWTSAVIPPPGHPHAGRIYVLESHRGLDIDRVLAITPP